MSRLSLALIMTWLIGGCAAIPPAVSIALLAADATSYVLTEKTMTDHALSEIVGRDCAVWRVINKRDICRDYEDTAVQSADWMPSNMAARGWTEIASKDSNWTPPANQASAPAVPTVQPSDAKLGATTSQSRLQLIAPAAGPQRRSPATSLPPPLPAPAFGGGRPVMQPATAVWRIIRRPNQ